jgi:hypothetical protein
MMSAGGGAGAGGGTTKNGLSINRYVDVSESVRHMPVGMVVIVDENHLPELLGAFANSKLHIQTTQYHWAHFKDKIKPNFDDEAGPGAEPREGAGPLAMGGRRGAKRPGGGGGDDAMGGGAGYPGLGGDRPPPRPDRPGRPGFGPGSSPFGGGPASPVGGVAGGGFGGKRPGAGTFPSFGQQSGAGLTEQSEDEEDLSLVEVAIYGIAAIYERYPPRETPATPPADPSNPNAQQPAAPVVK